MHKDRWIKPGLREGKRETGYPELKVRQQLILGKIKTPAVQTDDGKLAAEFLAHKTTLDIVEELAPGAAATFLPPSDLDVPAPLDGLPNASEEPLGIELGPSGVSGGKYDGRSGRWG